MTPAINPPTHQTIQPLIGEWISAGLKSELNYIDKFKTYYIFTDLGGSPLCVVGWVDGMKPKHM